MAQKEKAASGNSFPAVLWDYLAIGTCPTGADLVFVLAGRPERKVYGLQLYRQGVAPRLILSVGRFEVRQTVKLGFEHLNLRELTAQTPPPMRHFFIDLKEETRRVCVAGLRRNGTYCELESLARHLQFERPGSIILISTSIHLRRVRWCCEKIESLRRWNMSYIAVPEEMSSIRRDNWWKQFGRWTYVGSEWTKLVAYAFLYG
jgi:DUF218 domain